ncbi:MAG: hypothetical protein ACRCW2_02710 [Cellulosilyticaceae bacterium]
MGAFVQYVLDYFGKNIVLIASDPLFIGLSLLILYMYKRIAKEVNTSRYRHRMEYTAVKDIIRGACIGLLVSMCLELLGIRIPVTGQLVWIVPVALVMILLNPKFGCFSYVVPVTCFMHKVMSLCFTGVVFTSQTYRQLVLLVGILHIIEGLLVVLWGYENPREEPMQTGNKLIRVKKLTKYWPVPLVVFHPTDIGMTPLLLYAFLGYGDLARGDEEKQKSHLTGSIILLYGVCMTFLGWYCIRHVYFLPPIMVIMPVLHELIFKVTGILDNWIHKKKEARF